jgi:RNA polymerase-binding transcription factor DksA
MNNTKFKNIESYYLEQRDKIITALSKHEDIDIDGDEIDKIQGDSLADMLKKLSARELSKLNLINNALRALHEGTLDECEECSGTIGEKRLMVMPGVRNCIACAEELEKNAKMFA